MESSEIIKFFLNKGMQLDKHSLDYLSSNQNKITEISAKLDSLQQKPLVLTTAILQKLTQGKFYVRVYRTFEGGRKPKTIPEIVNFMHDRYKKLGGMLSSRLELTNLLSINKITDKTKKFSLIGLVKKIDESDRSLVVEDLTGEVKLFFESNNESFKQIILDEVVGAVCENENGVSFVRNLIYPDVPLKKDAQHTEEEIACYFISDIHLDSENFDAKRYNSLIEKIRESNGKKVIFLLGGISEKDGDVVRFLDDLPKDAVKIVLTNLLAEKENTIKASDPCVIDVCGVKVFSSYGKFFENYFHESNKTPADIFLNLIRKRHMNPNFNTTKNIFDNDPFLLDEVPDIFAVGYFHNPSSVNYKGTTVVSVGSLNDSPTFWKINLKTRENIRIDLV